MCDMNNKAEIENEAVRFPIVYHLVASKFK